MQLGCMSHMRSRISIWKW